MDATATREVITDQYAIYHADCIELMADLPDDSVHFSIYSPPFGGLYHYSSSERDLSNNGREEFFDHYRFVVAEIARLTMPGRLTAVHCTDISTGNSGKDSIYDFPGDIIRLHESEGWYFVTRHTIWKEPLWIRNKTMAKSLTHRTVVVDAAYGGVANADYLLMFRRKGENQIPIRHDHGFTHYAGECPIPKELLKYRNWKGDQTANKYSHQIWQRYASSVWDDINMGRVVPHKESKDPEDEKHVHVLPLDIIDRAVTLRSNPGETVLTPFMGVGSEVYGAVELGRRGIGIELKESYFKQAVRNLEAVLQQASTDALFA